MLEFLFWKTLAAAIMIASTTGSLGSFVVWRRMTFFGESLAHSLSLGIALNLLLFSGFQWGLIVVGILFMLAIYGMQKKMLFSGHATALHMIAHTSLAIGILLMYMFSPQSIDLHGLFFGNLLGITFVDLFILGVLTLVTGFFLIFLWKDLLFLSIDANLARAEGVKVGFVNGAFLVLLTTIVVVIIRMTGTLLISTVLVFPSSSARYLAKSPRGMLVYSVCVSVFAVVSGVMYSFYIDVPPIPAVVVVHGVIFLFVFLVYLLRSRLSRRNRQ